MSRPGTDLGYVPESLDDWDETEFGELDDMWEYEYTCDLEAPEVCESCT